METPSQTPSPIPNQNLSQSLNQSLRPTLSPKLTQPKPNTAAAEEGSQTSIEELRKEFELKLKKGLDERALLLDELFKQELDKRIAEMDDKLTSLQKWLTRDLNVNSAEKVFHFNLPNVRAFFSDTTKRFRFVLILSNQAELQTEPMQLIVSLHTASSSSACRSSGQYWPTM